MSRYDDYGGWPAYVSVSERKARAQAALTKLRQKNPGINPVTVTGRKLAKTWWGEAWNMNLEHYADFAYRIERGRSYVRHGAVLDLNLGRGRIKALVQGSRSKPYQVDITVDRLTPAIWDAVTEACEGAIGSLRELLEGKFPKDLGTLFATPGHGLFPAPREIHMSCSCPDWATLCKHVSAALYGVGVRLDENPRLFFELRGVDVEDLVSQAVAEKADRLIKKAQVKSRRVIDEDDDLGSLFGIDLQGDEPT